MNTEGRRVAGLRFDYPFAVNGKETLKKRNYEMLHSSLARNKPWPYPSDSIVCTSHALKKIVGNDWMVQGDQYSPQDASRIHLYYYTEPLG